MIETEARVMAYQPQSQEENVTEKEPVIAVGRKGMKANNFNRNGEKYKNKKPNTNNVINQWLLIVQYKYLFY
jgi:hypothetical protein